MNGHYRVRVVQADGVARYLGRVHGGYRRSKRGLRDHEHSTRYTTINGARGAARLYLAAACLGQHYADIIDDNDHEWRGEV